MWNAGLIAEPIAWGEKDKCEDEADDHIVLPTRPGEIPQDKSFQHLLFHSVTQTAAGHTQSKKTPPPSTSFFTYIYKPSVELAGSWERGYELN